jgi:hypothetical protein
MVTGAGMQMTDPTRSDIVDVRLRALLVLARLKPAPVTARLKPRHYITFGCTTQ